MKYFHLPLLCGLLLAACNKKGITVDVTYLKEGALCTQTIPCDFIDANGKIVSQYIDSVRFSYLDSIAFADNDPDRLRVYSTPAPLDFGKRIQPFSPEYYMVYTVSNVLKAIDYYNRLFDNRIDFNSDEYYKTVEVTIGDAPYLTSPRTFIFEAGSNPSPSLFFHEVGHRAFWYLEDGLGIRFKGLTYVHMGLLEYFTVSLNDSPLVGEDFLPAKAMRNAAWEYRYPPHDSLMITSTLEACAASYPDKLQDPESSISRFLRVNGMNEPEKLHGIIDNHRGGMIVTAALWRIREQLGQDVTDRLVARTILDLNKYLDMRKSFYHALENERMRDRIEWYDLYFGLIQKDRELNGGKGLDVVKKEFARTGFPVDRVTL